MARSPRPVSDSVRKAVEGQPSTSPVRQLFLTAFDLGWTVPLIVQHTGLSRLGVYRIIHNPEGLCRRSTLQKLRDTITTPPPQAETASTT